MGVRIAEPRGARIEPGRPLQVTLGAEVPVGIRPAEDGIAHRVIANPRVKVDRAGMASDASPISSTSSSSYRLLNTTDSRHMLPLADHVYSFSPVRANDRDLSRFHGTDERISIENYARMIAFYHRLIASASGPQAPRP